MRRVETYDFSSGKDADSTEEPPIYSPGGYAFERRGGWSVESASLSTEYEPLGPR